MKSDPIFVHEINKLIPLAEREAKAKVNVMGIKNEPRPGKLQPFYNHCFFTQFFHKAMIRLAIENELRTF